jgi:hypothetical protein
LRHTYYDDYIINRYYADIDTLTLLIIISLISFSPLRRHYWYYWLLTLFSLYWHWCHYAIIIDIDYYAIIDAIIDITLLPDYFRYYYIIIISICAAITYYAIITPLLLPLLIIFDWYYSPLIDIIDITLITPFSLRWLLILRHWCHYWLLILLFIDYYYADYFRHYADIIIDITPPFHYYYLIDYYAIISLTLTLHYFRWLLFHYCIYIDYWLLPLLIIAFITPLFSLHFDISRHYATFLIIYISHYWYYYWYHYYYADYAISAIIDIDIDTLLLLLMMPPFYCHWCWLLLMIITFIIITPLLIIDYIIHYAIFDISFTHWLLLLLIIAIDYWLLLMTLILIIFTFSMITLTAFHYIAIIDIIDWCHWCHYAIIFIFTLRHFATAFIDYHY